MDKAIVFLEKYFESKNRIYEKKILLIIIKYTFLNNCKNCKKIAFFKFDKKIKYKLDCCKLCNKKKNIECSYLKNLKKNHFCLLCPYPTFTFICDCSFQCDLCDYKICKKCYKKNYNILKQKYVGKIQYYQIENNYYANFGVCFYCKSKLCMFCNIACITCENIYCINCLKNEKTNKLKCIKCNYK